jgi:hypothetical protein
MLYLIRITWWPVLLVLNETFNNVSGITYDMLASFNGINATVNNISAIMYNMAFSFIGVYRHFQLFTMLYLIPDTLLKVSFNTNKTGHHVLHYIWHNIESVVVLLVFNNTFNNVSGITYNMVTSFIGV